MGEVLEALHRLQAIELQLAELRRQRDAKVRRVDYQRLQAKRAEEKLQETHLRIREHRKRLDALQLDAATREESIDKHRQALNRAKTNREYAGILTALNTEKADNSKSESNILRLMEEVERLKVETAKIEAENGTLVEDAVRAEETLRAYDAKSKKQRDALQADRDACAEKLPPTALNVFNRVADHHDGEAMAPVTKLHPKRDDYICSGCNMKITLEVINSLQIRDEIQVCKVCGRIHYLETPQEQRARR